MYSSPATPATLELSITNEEPSDKVTVVTSPSVSTPVTTTLPLISSFKPATCSSSLSSKAATRSVNAARSVLIFSTSFLMAVSSYEHDVANAIAAITVAATTDLRVVKIFLIVR